jgi:nitrate reductase delta subunit
VVGVGSETAYRRVLQLFADILDYPETNIVEYVRECEALVSDSSPDAAALLRQFQHFVEETPTGKLEEIYTGIFDLDSDCHPYVGYQLFGESYERSVFLLELKERYRSCGFEASENELPDRLSVLLRFLSMGGDGSPNQEIIDEGILPALDKMTTEAEQAEGQLPKGSDPYRQVLQALRRVLEQLRSVTVAAPDASSQEDSSNG